MVAEANAAGKRLQVNFNNRARPAARAIMEYLADGTVGRINSTQGKWIRRTGIPGFGGWSPTKALFGGGPQINLLQMIDLALCFIGYPEPEHVLGLVCHFERRMMFVLTRERVRIVGGENRIGFKLA